MQTLVEHGAASVTVPAEPALGDSPASCSPIHTARERRPVRSVTRGRRALRLRSLPGRESRRNFEGMTPRTTRRADAYPHNCRTDPGFGNPAARRTATNSPRLRRRATRPRSPGRRARLGDGGAGADDLHREIASEHRALGAVERARSEGVGDRWRSRVKSGCGGSETERTHSLPPTSERRAPHGRRWPGFTSTIR